MCPDWKSNHWPLTLPDDGQPSELHWSGVRVRHFFRFLLLSPVYPSHNLIVLLSHCGGGWDCFWRCVAGRGEWEVNIDEKHDSEILLRGRIWIWDWLDSVDVSKYIKSIPLWLYHRWSIRLVVIRKETGNMEIQDGSGLGACYTHLLPGQNWNYN